MKKLDIKTRDLRETDLFGLNPKKHLVLYTDNCKSHSTQQQKQSLATNKKINNRDLTPDATHMQQAVDQNVGVWLQDRTCDLYEDFVDTVYDDFDKGKRTEKVGTKEKRDVMLGLIYKSGKELALKPHLIQSSWNNFGVDLPFDGSKDGDVSTIK